MAVSYRTVGESALSGVDYIAVAGRVVFRAGTKARTVRVPLIDDALDESTEHFRVAIYNARGATIRDRSSLVRIFDDDPTPTMRVWDASVTEPTSGSTALHFPVTLSAASGRPISVSYVVTSGSATIGTDFVAAPSTGQLVLPAGTTSGFIPVTVFSDNLLESTETLHVTLFSPSRVSILDGSAVGSILDNSQPRLSVADVVVSEGDPARFVVSLNKSAPKTVTFRYSTSNGSATSPSDYVGVSSNNGTIAAGSSSTTITVNTVENTTPEATETFTLHLSNVVNAVVVDGVAQATILDDDHAPNLSINNATVSEGGTATFTVSLSKASSVPVSFNFGTVDGTAVAGSDYTSTSNSRTIPAGSTSTTINVNTIEDALDESDETFRVLLSNVSNATLTDGDGLGTINDDDPMPTLSILDPAAVNEGDDVVFTVTLSAVSGRTVTVDWETRDGDGINGTPDAEAPDDYRAASGRLTIPAGALSGQIRIETVNDENGEPAEKFRVRLSSPTNADISVANGIGTISASN